MEGLIFEILEYFNNLSPHVGSITRRCSGNERGAEIEPTLMGLFRDYKTHNGTSHGQKNPNW